MLPRLIIAVVATAIVLSSCDWLFPKKPVSAAYDFEGEWKLDTLYEPNDSSKMGLALLLLSMAIDDSYGKEASEVVYHFNKGTVVATLDTTAVDTATYKIEGSKMVMQNEQTADTFSFSAINDTLFSLTSPDSTTLFYRKIK
jgi:hypothetical protein